MNNIRQITNFSDEISQGTPLYETIMVGDNVKKMLVEYRILSAEILTGSKDTPINKIGYVCEPRGIDYPIYIVTDGINAKQIRLGKTGMFETMPEVFLDANDEEAEELDCTPKITSIRVPIGEIDDYYNVPKPINFKLDYVFATN